MRGRKRDLRDDILRVVLLKLVLISALWWLFFRGEQVTADAPATAQHLVSAPPQSINKGETHAQ